VRKVLEAPDRSGHQKSLIGRSVVPTASVNPSGREPHASSRGPSAPSCSLRRSGRTRESLQAIERLARVARFPHEDGRIAVASRPSRASRPFLRPRTRANQPNRRAPRAGRRALRSSASKRSTRPSIGPPAARTPAVGRETLRTRPISAPRWWIVVQESPAVRRLHSRTGAVEATDGEPCTVRRKGEGEGSARRNPSTDPGSIGPVRDVPHTRRAVRAPRGEQSAVGRYTRPLRDVSGCARRRLDSRRPIGDPQRGGPVEAARRDCRAVPARTRRVTPTVYDPVEERRRVPAAGVDSQRCATFSSTLPGRRRSKPTGLCEMSTLRGI
jgi:hypothetical protein